MRHVVWGLLAALAAGAIGCDSLAPSSAGDGPAAGDPGPPPAWTADMRGVADGSTRFACDLYGKLREEKGNLFLSPYSAHTALAMTTAGANGTTRDQMVAVLRLPAGKDLVSGELGKFYAQQRKDYELSVANALWGQKGWPWKADFLAVQKDRFGAGFREADFVTAADSERQRINKWVEDQTRDKIKELLQPGHINTWTRMVLVNAVYFKGRWEKAFDPKATRAAPFHLADGGTVPVPLMFAETKCRFASFEGGEILELPYRGGELAMVVILPAKPTGLPAVERQLTADTLGRWLGGLRETELEVALPRFRCEWRFNLRDPLMALGMTDAFVPGKADFSGMATDPPGAISAVVHKAFVDVNEEGTEAAAATAVAMADSARPTFRAARPFLFLIRDVKHGTVLFLGRVTNPKG